MTLGGFRFDALDGVDDELALLFFRVVGEKGGRGEVNELLGRGFAVVFLVVSGFALLGAIEPGR
jgi:hypothetical protein